MIETIIPSILNDLVDKRVYWNTTPKQLETEPAGAYKDFIIVQLVGGTAGLYVDQTVPGKQHARVQVVACSSSPMGSGKLMGRAMLKFAASGYPVQVYDEPISGYDASRQVHSNMQIFGIWFDRPNY